MALKHHEQPNDDSLGPLPEVADGLRLRWSALALRVNSVNGDSATLGAATATVGKYGVQAACQAGQQNIEWPRQFLTTSDGAGTGDFAVLVVANPAAGGGSVGHVFAQKNDAAGAPYSQLGLLANSNASGVYSSGSFAFFTYSGLDTGVASAGACDGDMHVWFARRAGGTMSLWRDGILLASSALASRPIIQAGSDRYTAIGSRGNGTSEAFGGDVVLAAAWDLAPPDALIAGLRTVDDCRDFLWPPETLWLPVSAVGASVPTITAVSAENITATSADYRVTLDFA